MPVYVDISRCIGCRACEVACQRVHDGDCHVRVKLGDRASMPQLCHHCEEAACAFACYTGALSQNGQRIAYDIHKCTGCGLCRLACPFGAVWTDKLAHKCDLCSPRERPTCVITCPAEALSDDYEFAAKRARGRAALLAAKGVRR
jgi:formate dehydrogenase iron-sulfur subunit